MTDLTEQWKKGELPSGWYWVKRVTWSECIDMLYYTSDIFLDGDVPVDNDNITEVLAEVPDYVEWRNMVNCACEEHEANKRFIEENAQLKELLKECREVIKNVDKYYGNYDSINGYLVVDKIDEALR